MGAVGLDEEEPGSREAAGIRLNVTAPDGESLLPGRYRLELDGAIIWVPGPWTLRWSLYP